MSMPNRFAKTTPDWYSQYLPTDPEEQAAFIARQNGTTPMFQPSQAIQGPNGQSGWKMAGNDNPALNNLTPGEYYAQLLNHRAVQAGMHPGSPDAKQFELAMYSRNQVRPEEMKAAYNAAGSGTGGPHPILNDVMLNFLESLGYGPSAGGPGTVNPGMKTRGADTRGGNGLDGPHNPPGGSGVDAGSRMGDNGGLTPGTPGGGIGGAVPVPPFLNRGDNPPGDVFNASPPWQGGPPPDFNAGIPVPGNHIGQHGLGQGGPNLDPSLFPPGLLENWLEHKRQQGLQSPVSPPTSAFGGY